MGLTWERVDLHNGTIRLDAGETKSGEGRVYRPGNEVMEVLREQWEKRKVVKLPGKSPALLSHYVFHRNGKRIGGKYGWIQDVWRRACCKTEVLDARGAVVTLGKFVEVEENGKKVRKYVGRLFHDFRRSAIRDMIRSGIDKEVAKKISGTRPTASSRATISPRNRTSWTRRRSAPRI